MKARSLGDDIGEIIAAMRAGGAGKIRIGELEIDLTCPPMALPNTEPVEVEDADERALRIQQEHAGIAFGASGGRRVKLPMSGFRRSA